MDDNLKQHPEFHNFVSVFRGFVYVGKVLEPYTRAGLRTVHQDGYKRFAGLPPCTQRCSEHYGRNTTQWCPTCRTWNTYLLQKHRNLRVRWENTESWKWSGHYGSIADVFLPPTWSDTDTQLDDFTTACHIWSNCKEFNLTKPLIQTLRHLRNKQVGHNTKLKVTDSNKVKVFDELKKLLSCNAVQAYINLTKCEQELENIAKVYEMTSVMTSLFKELETIGSVQNNHGVCLNDIVTILNTVNERIIELPIDTQNKPRQRYKAPSWKLTSLIVFVLLMITMSYVKYPQNEECLSEMYSYPFPQDMPLLPYVKEHASLIGREWLFEEIKMLIFQRNSRTRGVLLTADIGYGKSAIVKHLLCSKKDEKGYGITERIVAFHICKFDVPSTRNAQRFVHRLIGFFATNCPEFGGIISMLPDSALIYDHEKCGKEIVACFDQGLLHPLNEIKSKPDFPFIVIIDALDECLNDERDSELFHLLLTRYRKMPKWVLFIITSRNITLVHQLHSLDELQLKVVDQRNIADIKNYIQYKESQFPSIFNDPHGLETLLDQSEGNFLFIVHLINYMLTNQNNEKNALPNTLSEIYEMNFERHFNEDNIFKVAKSILEIVVASLQPLYKIDVEVILHHTNPAAMELFPITFERLAFCFRTIEGLTIVHQSLNSWLISEDNKRFQISIESGHTILSKYLLGQGNKKRAHDIVDIIIHVVNSKSSVTMKDFEAASGSFNITRSSIHQLIWKSDSEHALKLLLKLNVAVDTLNEGNVTPAFVAAARGHLNQLKYLKSKGADLNFIVNSSYLITSPKQIEIIKHDYYFGYGLIHIATQFGHVKIVEYLLKQNKSKAYTRNGLRLTVVEIACENGHLAVLKILDNHVSDFGNCIYYAAKNGHTNIVRYMIKLQVNETCVSFEKAMKSLGSITSLDISKSVLKFRSDHISIKYEMYDLWWLIHQESALHVAISSHHSETAELLVHNYPQLVECTDSNGMTPFLLTVAVNETSLFKFLIDRISRDKCSHASVFDRKKVDEKLKTCPLGASYAHLDAIYRRFDLTKVIFEQDIEVDWLSPDAMSVTAVHYAACNDNSMFLHFIGKTLKLSYNGIKTTNGSSPFHSAAICGSLGSIYEMTSSLTYNIPNLKDSENKTILHYLVISECFGNPAEADIVSQSVYVNILTVVINNSAIMLDDTDCYKRNVIHYALKNGHFMIVNYVYHHHSDLLATMLEQKDINGITPVKFAVTNGSFDPEKLVSPNHCVFYDIFFAHCGSGEQFVKHLSSIEYGLLRVLTFLKSDMFRHFLPIFQDLVKKSPYLATAVLEHLKNETALAVIKTKFIASIRESPSPYSVYALAKHQPQWFSACGKPFQESPLHLISYRFNTMHVLHDMDFHIHAIGKQIDMKSLSCADSNGYNSFHYSLFGGNIKMARTLLANGVHITNEKVVLADIPWMVVLGKKSSFVSNESMCSDQLSCMDDLLYNIFSMFRDKFKYSDICNGNKYRLSLVHVIGASGLVRTLKVLEDIFGSRVIKCKNRHGLSPLYLGDLLNEGNWRATLGISDTQMPYSITEAILLMFMLNTDPIRHHCMISESRYYDKYSLQKFIVCINRFRYYLEETSSLHGLLEQAFFELHLFDLANLIESKFQNALITKKIIELRAYLGIITALVRDFEDMLFDMGVTHNYRGLTKLISLQDKRRRCSLHEADFDHVLPCFKVCIEFNHMVRKTITAVKSQWLQNCYKEISTRKINQPFFRKTKLKQVILRSEFELSRFNPHLSEFVSEHDYLHILKRTTKYQWVKHYFPKRIYFFNTNYVSKIKKPFDDLVKETK